jgi:hypothetical protein
MCLRAWGQQLHDLSCMGPETGPGAGSVLQVLQDECFVAVHSYAAPCCESLASAWLDRSWPQLQCCLLVLSAADSMLLLVLCCCPFVPRLQSVALASLAVLCRQFYGVTPSGSSSCCRGCRVPGGDLPAGSAQQARCHQGHWH